MRTTSDTRIRGRKLQAIRAAHFAKHPLCVMCNRQGRTSVATELDHIQALGNGGEDVAANRQGLCATCHEAKTAQDLGYTVRTRFGPDGNPVGV